MIKITYNSFIQNIINTRGQFNCGNEYYEKHHIIPKCLGGSDDKSNLINLFAEEHFIAHKLLAQENPDNINLARAYNIMAFSKNQYQQGKRYELTPEEYAEARIHFSNTMKKYYENKTNHPCYGTHISEERKQLISRVNKGNKYCVGRILSEETKKKIGDANRNPTEETRAKMSASQKIAKAGAKNNRAKKVIRLSDGKIYDYGKQAAKENNINYSTFKSRIHKKQGDFMYYEDWLKQNNNLEK